jgi:hypothetical protein
MLVTIPAKITVESRISISLIDLMFKKTRYAKTKNKNCRKVALNPLIGFVETNDESTEKRRVKIVKYMTDFGTEILFLLLSAGKNPK